MIVLPALFIVDANVLIDFCRTDATLLALVNRHVGTVHVASVVLDKVDQLSRQDADRLGLAIVEPDIELAADAASRSRTSPLAFDDWVCLLLARARQWTCVTNDRRLRGECATVGVDVLWGLQLLGVLVQKGVLPSQDAIAAAWAIHRTNPRFIPEHLVKKFSASLARAKPAK